MKKKICFVIQRYGRQILGGSESYCRQIAEKLTECYDVDVLTTKCTDYISWANDIEIDEESLSGIRVLRFPTARERYLSSEHVDRAFSAEATVEDGIEWVKAQGPYVPNLIEYVRMHQDDYDVFVLVTYLYYPTVMSSFEIGDKAVLIPTAHDESCIYQPVMEKMFEEVAGLYYLTPEEKAFVEETFHAKDVISNSGLNGGVGVEIPRNVDARAFRERYGLGDDPYVVYAGRVEVHKGFPRLFSYFEDYKDDIGHHNNLKLVLLGSAVLEIPEREDILYLGFVSEEEKFSAMAGATALIQPSDRESLSIVLLEAMGVGTPVLVSGKCDVLKGHCLRSNAGLYFENYLEFCSELDYLLDHEEERGQMGANALRYVENNYRWDSIIEGLRDVIDQVIAQQQP